MPTATNANGQPTATNVPTAFVFEGGYAVKELGVNVVNVLEGFETAL